MLDIINKNGTIIGKVSRTDRIIAANAAEFKQQINALFDKPNVKLVLDLQNVKFIDSTGIGALISILKTARQNDGIFQLCALQKDVYNLLALMKLDKVFDLLPDQSHIN
ncbi:MAG: STAS domain-containing protein [Breznakibacter sp.]